MRLELNGKPREAEAGATVASVIRDVGLDPRFVIVEARQRRLGIAYRPFDDIAFYGTDPRFAAAWRCYEEIEPMRHLRLFQRREGC